MSSRRRGMWKTLSLVAALGIGAPAAAQETCSEEADCGKGFTCEVVATGGGIACPAIDCAEGEDCKLPPECQAGAADRVDEIRACVPAACSSNTDCADGMVCHTVTNESCAGSAGAPCADNDEDCEPAPAEEPVCETTTRSACVPRYVLPCETASDCGEGFECVTREVCSTSAGGGAEPGSGSAGGSDQGGDDGDAKDLPAPPADQDGGAGAPLPEVVCEPLDEKYCRLIEMECDAEADCPEGFSCESEGSDDLPCATPEGDADAQDRCDAFAPAPERKLCVPPYGEYFDVDFDTATDGRGTGSLDDNGDGTGKGGEEAPTVGGAESEEESSDKKDDSGCSVLGAPGQSAGGAGGMSLVLASLLGAAFVSRRRKQAR